MYNETIRKQEAQAATLAYERKAGIKEGIKQGKLFTYISLVKEGHLSKKIAANELNISIEEFEKYL